MNASKFCFMVLFFLLAGWVVSLSANALPCKRACPIQNFQWSKTITPQGKLYSLTVPKNSKARFVIGVSPKLETVESPSWKKSSEEGKPVFVINGGFFDPNNGKTTSYLYHDGVKVGDPHDNAQLVKNPKLQPYLTKIFNRTEFRRYDCNESVNNIRYDIVQRNAPIPAGCTLKEVLGAGPRLLPEVASLEEGFIDYDSAGKMTRDPIGVNAKNARSVLGIDENGAVIVLMGAQVPEEGKKGFSLQDMASELKARGAVKAMALDGGSSSGLVYQGAVHYGKFNPDGSPVIRPVKSVLMLLEP